MYSVLVSVLLGLAVGLGLGLTGVSGYGWSTFFGVLTFVAGQVVIGMRLRKRVTAVTQDVQNILAAGQKQMQAKVARWQMRPPGSVQEAQAELARERRVFVKDALDRSEALHAFERWIPMLGRQIATIQIQLHWLIPDFKKVDALMPKALFIDPTMAAMKIARMYMRDEPSEAIAKVYDKAVRRLRYNQNALLAATYSWILVQRKDVDGAFKALVRALEKSDNPVLKANRDTLANNRVAHFTNSGLGDPWYALQLEEPRMHHPRQRMQWR